MKKTLLLLIFIFIISCAPKRVCGGSGGKRCVENSKEILVIKAIS